MALPSFLVGSNPGEKLVIGTTVVVYVVMGIRRPATAKASLAHGGRTLLRLATLIIAAMFLAAALQTLLTAVSLTGVIGGQAGLTGVVIAGYVGGVLPGGPYAVYPIISGLWHAGLTRAGLLAMLTGYGAIGSTRVSYGLIFFEPRIVGSRLVLSLVVTAVVAVLLGVLVA